MDISTVCPRSLHTLHSLALTRKSPPYQARSGSTIEMSACLSVCELSAVFFTFQLDSHFGHFILHSFYNSLCYSYLIRKVLTRR